MTRSIANAKQVRLTGSKCACGDEGTTQHVAYLTILYGDHLRCDKADREVHQLAVTILLRTFRAPSLKPAAENTVTLSIIEPAQVRGRALIQSPDPGEHEATIRV